MITKLYIFPILPKISYFSLFCARTLSVHCLPDRYISKGAKVQGTATVLILLMDLKVLALTRVHELNNTACFFALL